MLSANSNFSELITLLEEADACQEGIDWCLSLGDITLIKAMEAMQNDPECKMSWICWNWIYMRNVMPRNISIMFLQKIATRPRLAAHAYIHTDDLTVSEQQILLNSFRDKFPTIEHELATEKVKPKWGKHNV